MPKNSDAIEVWAHRTGKDAIELMMSDDAVTATTAGFGTIAVERSLQADAFPAGCALVIGDIRNHLTGIEDASQRLSGLVPDA